MSNNNFKALVREFLKEYNCIADEKQIYETAESLEELARLFLIFNRRHKEKYEKE